MTTIPKTLRVYPHTAGLGTRQMRRSERLDDTCNGREYVASVLCAHQETQGRVSPDRRPGTRPLNERSSRPARLLRFERAGCTMRWWLTHFRLDGG